MLQGWRSNVIAQMLDNPNPREAREVNQESEKACAHMLCIDLNPQQNQPQVSWVWGTPTQACAVVGKWPKKAVDSKGVLRA